MNLKSLWIDGFKNLNDFKIDFENRYGITVLIGNNASGKSNILEAISAIFSHIYDDNLSNLSFKFDIVYLIKDVDIRISKKQKIRYRIKRPTAKTWNKLEKLYFLGNRFPLKFPVIFDEEYDYRPSQVIALYSGEELRLWENYYQKPYLERNKQSLASDSYLSHLKILYINKHYWDIALLTMYASDLGEKVKSIVNFYLKSIEIQINTELWGSFIQIKPSNAVNNFIYKFMEEEIDGDGVDWPHTFNLKLGEFKERTDYKTHTELFNLLCVAKLPKDPKYKLITSLELTFENGTTTKDLSEGQKKQILLKLALEVLADENSLLLFDEPDAHIHISNKKLIPEMLKDYSNREVILTTHSPTLAHSFDNKHIAYVEDGKINTKYNSKEKILNELTNGFMGVSEQQMLLQSNKDILIVEGKTDEAYISAALKALKTDDEKYKDLDISAALKALKTGDEKYKDLDFNFLWLGGTDVDALNKVIKGFTPKENQTIIAFFDSDDNGFKCIQKALEYKGLKDNFNGDIKNGIHIYFYPKKDDFEGGNFEVEDYFPIETLQNFVIKKDAQNFQSLKTKFNKRKFAEECKKDDFDKSNFDGFKKLFDLILIIKNKQTTKNGARNGV